jgi:hypothetical protein
MCSLWLALGIITSPVFALEGRFMSPSESVIFLTKVERVLDVIQINLDLLEKQAQQTMMPSDFDNTQDLSQGFQNNIQFIFDYVNNFCKDHQSLLNNQRGKFVFLVSSYESGNAIPITVKSMIPWTNELKTLSIKSYSQAESSLTFLNNLKKKVTTYESKIIKKKQKLNNDILDKVVLERQNDHQNEGVFQLDEDLFVS